MNELPFISIAFLTYNNEDCLSRALDSLLAQTYRNFVIHVYDDCSQDKSYEMVMCYAKKDSRIIVQRHEKNLGAYQNLFQAKEKVNGDYFLWACPDDFYAPTFLEECLKVLEKNPLAVGVLPFMKLIFTNGSEVLKEPETYVAMFLNLIPENYMEKLVYARKILKRDQSLGAGAQYCCFLQGIIRGSHLNHVFFSSKNAYGYEELFPAWMVCLGGLCTVNQPLFTKYQDLKPLSERNTEFSLVHKESLLCSLRSIFLFMLHVWGSRAFLRCKLEFFPIILFAIYRKVIFAPVHKMAGCIVCLDQKHGSYLKKFYRFIKGKHS
jgi:glycosyltransferase involved in cell wall biosynthesis